MVCLGGSKSLQGRGGRTEHVIAGSRLGTALALGPGPSLWISLHRAPAMAGRMVGRGVRRARGCFRAGWIWTQGGTLPLTSWVALAKFPQVPKSQFPPVSKVCDNTSAITL